MALDCHFDAGAAMASARSPVTAPGASRSRRSDRRPESQTPALPRGCRTNQTACTNLTMAAFADLVRAAQSARAGPSRPKWFTPKPSPCGKPTKSRPRRWFVRQPRCKPAARTGRLLLGGSERTAAGELTPPSMAMHKRGPPGRWANRACRIHAGAQGSCAGRPEEKHKSRLALQDRAGRRQSRRTGALGSGRTHKPAAAECWRYPDERFLGKRSSGRVHRRDASGPVGSRRLEFAQSTRRCSRRPAHLPVAKHARRWERRPCSVMGYSASALAPEHSKWGRAQCRQRSPDLSGITPAAIDRASPTDGLPYATCVPAIRALGDGPLLRREARPHLKGRSATSPRSQGWQSERLAPSSRTTGTEQCGVR